MKLKKELYKTEQCEICDKIIDILELDNDKSITLYELDNDKVKQQKILDLIPNIRKYFSFGSIVGASEPENTKRPWLSIIRHITKIKYQLIYGDYTKKINDTRIRTKRYIFLLK
jgi:hypothetical protein